MMQTRPQGGVGARYLGIGTPKQNNSKLTPSVVMRLVSGHAQVEY